MEDYEKICKYIYFMKVPQKIKGTKDVKNDMENV